MLLNLTLIVAQCILLVVVIRYATCLRTFVDSSKQMHYTLLHVSRKNFHSFPFPGSCTRYSAYSVILDEKLCSRANVFDKLPLRDSVCMNQQIVVVKCKLMATLKLAIRKSGSPIFLLKQHMLSTMEAVAFRLITVLQFKPQSQERRETQES